MKKTMTLFSFLFCVTISFAQTYVNASATGANDGTSWTDAYASLNDAIENSLEGDEIWVAAGTYLPEVQTTASFTLIHDLALYGGFAGTETSIEDRDPSVNETIMSGDQNGDDILNNFTSNREDNNTHVVYLDDTVTNATIIDGFIIEHGHTAPEAGSGDDRRGGGILAYGSPIVNNCTFRQNFGWYGGGIYPRSNAEEEPTIITNCLFENNEGGLGAGVYTITDYVTVESCLFSNNTTSSLGGGLYCGSAYPLIANCQFEDNETTTSRGGGLYMTNAVTAEVMNCDFTDNLATSSSGGAAHFTSSNDNTFVSNYMIKSCNFENSNATFGGSVSVYSLNTAATFDDCYFANNYAENVGGALSNAFGASTTLLNSVFEFNQSNISGGALFNQNDGGTMNVDNCLFESNAATTRGGAINYSGDGDDNLSKLTISNSRISNNLASEQGGGINLDDANLEVISCLIDYNFNTADDAIGGGMSLNTGDTTDMEISILNSTIAYNSGSSMAGIAHYSNDVESTSILTIQNTILANPDGDNYTIEAGTPEAVSNGGNLSSDFTAEEFLINTNDLNEMEPLFLEEAGMEFYITDESPCVNKGVPDGAPATDIEGNPRVGEVDMGAYENQNMVNIKAVKWANESLSIFPNPVSNGKLVYLLNTKELSAMDVLITDVNGQEVYRSSLNHNRTAEQHTITLVDMSAGAYNLIIYNQNFAANASFIKM